MKKVAGVVIIVFMMGIAPVGAVLADNNTPAPSSSATSSAPPETANPSAASSSGDNSPNGSGTAEEENKKRKKNESSPETSPPTSPVGIAPKKKTEPPTVETLVSSTGILIPAGKLLVENSLEYIHNTASQLAIQGFTVVPAILVGSINVQSVSQDYYMDILTFYYGLTNRLEIEADVPYVYRTENVVTRPIASSSSPIDVNSAGSNIGDVQFGLHYQFNQSGMGGTFFLGNVMVKSNSGSNPFSIPINSNTGLLTVQPTGTGFWSVEPGLTVLFPSDPAVFYANAGYIYNFPTNFGGSIGTINPGNATDLSFGAGFSLNEQTSFSIGYDQMTMWPPTENGVQIPLTRVLQMGSLMFGYSYNVSRYFFYMLNVEAGVTPDAPNVQITFRIPLFY